MSLPSSTYVQRNAYIRFKRRWRMILGPLRSSWSSNARAFGATGVHAVVTLGAPLLAKRAVDEVLVGTRYDRLPVYLFLFFMIAAISALCIGVRKYEANRLTAHLSEHYRRRLFEHLQELPPAYHETLGAGQILSRFSSDVSKVESLISNLHFNFLTSLVACVGSVMLFFIEPVMAGVVVTLLVVAGGIAVYFSREMTTVSRAVQDRLGVLSQFIEQQVRGIGVVKGHGLEQIQRERGDDLAADLYEVGLEMTFVRSRFAAGFLAMPSAASIAVMAIGGWYGYRGQITPGTLVAFLHYLALLIAALPVLNEVSTVWPQAWASLSRITEVLDETPQRLEPASPIPLPPGTGHIRFADVTFGFERNAPIFEHLSAEIEEGTCVGIVGVSGSGKSALGQLLLRFEHPWSGEISIDGADISQVATAELRASISLVPAQPFVFSGTVRDNIALGKLGADDDEVVHAAKLAGADGFIEKLPQKYDTVIGEQGSTLSGGQRQRLAIARALVRQPRILILDDSTSSVDPALEVEILRNVRDHATGTVLVVANRAETLQFVDRILVLEGGAMVYQEPAERRAAQSSLRVLKADGVAGIAGDGQGT